MEKMENKEKRIYLTLENQKKIVRAFFDEWKGKDFGRKEFKSFLIENYDWFEKASQSIQNSRLEKLISVMKTMYGKKLEPQRGGQPGVETIWLLPIVATELTAEGEEEKPKLKRKVEKPKRHCSVDRLMRFYNVAKMASRPIGGITKKDLATIMGYKNTSMASQGIESLNNLFKLETGLRPLEVNKDHTFINLDIIHVDRVAAELIMEDLLEKLKGVEPKEPEVEYEGIVKRIVKSDYHTLKMFEGKLRLEYRNSDAMLFRKNIIGDCNVMITGNSNSMENVVKSFIESLFNRYKIEISVDVKPYQYVQLMSSQDDLKEALKKIEDKYAEFFCENIVPHERTVLAADIKKETEPNMIEEDIIKIVESIIFKNESGSLFVSQIWEKFDKLHIERRWDLLGVLRKCPRFSIRDVSRGEGLEPCVYYTAPEPTSDGKDSLPSDTTVSSFDVYFGFTDEGDLLELCKNLECVQLDEKESVGPYFMCAVKCDKNMSKIAMRSLLRLCYMADAKGNVVMIYHHKDTLQEFLEKSLFEEA